MVDKAESLRHITEAPSNQGAGGSDSDIEITPQIIEAGVIALERYRESYDDVGLVEVVYIAMRSLEGRDRGVEKET